jgi:hypothetical protein
MFKLNTNSTHLQMINRNEIKTLKFFLQVSAQTEVRLYAKSAKSFSERDKLKHQFFKALNLWK